MATASLIGIHELRELLRPVAAAVTVYLGSRAGAVADAERDRAGRLRTMLRDLSAEGADDASLEAVADHLAMADPMDQAVFAREGRIVLDHAVPGAVMCDMAAFGAPPRVVPLLAWFQANPAFVHVAADRRGAELIAVPAGAADGTHQLVGHPSMAAIGPLVAEQLDLVRARALVLSGHPDAISLITVYLRQAGRTPAIAVLPEARDAQAHIADRARLSDVLASYSPAETAERVARVVEGLRPRGPAVAGADQTLAALARGLIRSLVVVGEPADVRTAWWGGGLLCSSFRPGATLPGSQVRQGRLVDVAVRAALMTRAEVRVLTPQEGAAVPDGIGGLLRTSGEDTHRLPGRRAAAVRTRFECYDRAPSQDSDLMRGSSRLAGCSHAGT